VSIAVCMIIERDDRRGRVYEHLVMPGGVKDTFIAYKEKFRVGKTISQGRYSIWVIEKRVKTSGPAKRNGDLSEKRDGIESF